MAGTTTTRAWVSVEHGVGEDPASCPCWDCGTRRRNSARIAVAAGLLLAAACAMLVAWEATAAFAPRLDDGDAALVAAGASFSAPPPGPRRS